VKSKRIFLIISMGFFIGLTLSLLDGAVLGGFLEKIKSGAKEAVEEKGGKAT